VIELTHSLTSRVENISPFVGELIRFMRRLFEKFGYSDDSEFEIEIAVREALSNAIIHGNDQDPQKRVYIACAFSMDGDVSITIRDEGQGFDIGAVPDPTNQQNLLVNKGPGIQLMRAHGHAKLRSERNCPADAKEASTGAA
jgi:serine/threonine-protein kinase RsbW